MPHQPWICPACGLLCDDAAPLDATKKLQVTASDIYAAQCERSRQWQESVATHGSLAPTATVSWQQVATRLQDAKSPLIVLGDVGVENARWAMALADAVRATVVLDQSPTSHRVDSHLSRSGHMMLTLGEVRSRADLVVLINPQLKSGGLARWPRLLDRFVTAQLPAGHARTVVLLHESSFAEHSLEHIPCPAPRLSEFFSQFRARLTGATAEGEVAVQRLWQLLQGKEYIAWVWNDDDLPDDCASLLNDVSAINTLLGAERLAGSLRLRDRPGLVTAAQVCTWQSGIAPPLRFTPTGPEAMEVMHWEAFDAVLVVSPLGFPRYLTEDRFAKDVFYVAMAPGSPLAAGYRMLPGPVPGSDAYGRMSRGDGAMMVQLAPLPNRAREGETMPPECVLQRMVQSFTGLQPK